METVEVYDAFADNGWTCTIRTEILRIVVFGDIGRFIFQPIPLARLGNIFLRFNQTIFTVYICRVGAYVHIEQRTRIVTDAEYFKTVFIELPIQLDPFRLDYRESRYTDIRIDDNQVWVGRPVYLNCKVLLSFASLSSYVYFSNIMKNVICSYL